MMKITIDRISERKALGAARAVHLYAETTVEAKTLLLLAQTLADQFRQKELCALATIIWDENHVCAGCGEQHGTGGQEEFLIRNGGLYA